MSKHRWSIEQKRQHVTAWRASGLTRQQYCELNDIPFKLLREWPKDVVKDERQANEPTVLPVHIAPPLHADVPLPVTNELVTVYVKNYVLVAIRIAEALISTITRLPTESFISSWFSLVTTATILKPASVLTFMVVFIAPSVIFVMLPGYWLRAENFKPQSSVARVTQGALIRAIASLPLTSPSACWLLWVTIATSLAPLVSVSSTSSLTAPVATALTVPVNWLRADTVILPPFVWCGTKYNRDGNTSTY